MTLEQAKLIKRMAWQNMQERKPTEDDVKYVLIAVRMLSYIGALDYALFEFQDALQSAGHFRHAVKRIVLQSQALVMAVHSEAYRALGTISTPATRQYNDMAEATFAKCQECILLNGEEKPYNIVISLCRLIEKLNKQLKGRYDFAPARKLYRIPSLLSVCQLHDYDIDQIIEQNTKKL